MRQLDDSFTQLGIGQRPSVGLHENAEAERTDTTFFLMSELQKLSDEFRQYRMSEVHRNEEIMKLISECRTRDELIQQKDAMIMSLVSSLEEQMSSATSPRVASGEDSKTYLKPSSMAQYPGTLQHGTSTEYRPEMATFSKEVSLATGKYVDMESGLKPHSLGREVSDVKSHSQQTETQKIKTVTEVANGSSKQPEQAHDTTPNANAKSAGTSGVKMKPATFDGSTSWLDYKTHFDMCAELNGWSIVQKGLYLAVSLRGHAQGVLGNLPAEDRNNFEKLIKALSERFSPESQTELYRAQLKERQWKHGENIPEFGQRILRLTTLAYPGANASLIDTLAMGNFIDSISDSDMRLKIQQTRPKVFNEAVKVAVELEAFDKAERQRQGNKYVRGTSSNSTPDDGSSETTVILQKLSKFLDQADATNTPSSSDVRGQYSTQRKVRCYKCKKLRHIQRNCPYNKNQSTESTENRKGQGEGSNMKRVGRFCDKRSSRKRARKSKRIASTRCVEAGMYLPVQINGINTDMLIDSGATASLISVEVFNKMANQPILKPVKGEMVAVNGMNLKTHGFCDFDVIIGRFCYSIRAIVAELNTSGLLGLDFLSEYECAIDLRQMCIVLDGKRINCEMKGKIGCNTVQKEVPVKPGRTNLCECCPKTFSSMSDLLRHMRRAHKFEPKKPSEPTATLSVLPVTSSAEELEAGAPLDELGSDPDIELVADEVAPKILVTMADDIPTVRKRTKPAPVVSGKKLKLPLLSLSGKPFDFGEKVVASDKSAASVLDVRSEPEILPVNTSEANSKDVSCCTPATATVTTATASFSTRDFGIQCSMDRSRVEHHKVVETVKVFKEGDAEVTTKEVHETRWVE